MEYNLKDRVDEFFGYAIARQEIKLARDKGLPAPWTEDPILRNYRFCNVFREDDKVTRWFSDNIRNPLRKDPRVLLATFAFRIFNLPESGKTMLNVGGGLDVFSTEGWKKNRKKIAAAISKQDQKVTGAYMTKTPTGMNKTEGTMWIIDNFIAEAKVPIEKMAENIVHFEWTLEKTTSWLSGFDFMGPFLAYEVVTDLYHTYVLEEAKDIFTWANPGPGAARGLSRLLGEDPTRLKRQRPQDVAIMMDLMRELLETSHQYWPKDWPEWDMRTVEHSLCEFDKYERVRLGEGTPKQKYNGRGA